jgi:hypothetical protein
VTKSHNAIIIIIGVETIVAPNMNVVRGGVYLDLHQTWVVDWVEFQ